MSHERTDDKENRIKLAFLGTIQRFHFLAPVLFNIIVILINIKNKYLAFFSFVTWTISSTDLLTLYKKSQLCYLYYPSNFFFKMGGGGSKKAEKVRTPIKLLLLGGGNVGKSTIFRQMNLLYGEGFTPAHKLQARSLIYENILETAFVLASNVNDLDIVEDDPLMDNADKIQRFLIDFRLAISDANNNSKVSSVDHKSVVVSEDIWISVESILNDKRCVPLLENPKLDLVQSASYLVEHFSRIRSIEFMPTDQDCLRLRRSTQGDAKLTFDIDLKEMDASLRVTCVDVGGQAHEQVMWPKHAADLNAIVYIAAVSEYNNIRDGGISLLQEQFELLSNVCNSSDFKNATIITLLNKSDLLEAKVAKSDQDAFKFSKYFSDYDGSDGDKDAIISFFKSRVEQIVRSSKIGNVTAKYPNFDDIVIETTAIDTGMMETVLRSLIKATLIQCLGSMGLFSV